MRTILHLLVALVLVGAGACASEDSGQGTTAVDDDTATEQEEDQEECLVTEDIEEGDGKEATIGSVITAHYTGTLEDGTEFDSSRDPGRKPLRFVLSTGSVIEGWVQGIPGMREGGRRKLTICSDMGYGETGFPPTIPPGATLIFDVELLKVTQE